MTAGSEEVAMLLRLAEQDRMAFLTLYANPDIELRVVGFHAQQAVEKFLKALQVARGKIFAPTHDLARLAQTLQASGAALPLSIDALKRLNPYAVAFRYDGRDIHTLTRDEILALVDSMASFAKATLSGSH
jgi:HEPN domain-containing protein